MTTQLKNVTENRNCDEFDMLAAALTSERRLFFDLEGEEWIKTEANSKWILKLFTVLLILQILTWTYAFIVHSFISL